MYYLIILFGRKGYFVYPLFSVIPSYKFVEEKKVREIQIYKGLDAR